MIYMFSKITAFILSIITFILSLFGIDIVKDDPSPVEIPQQKIYFKDDCMVIENVSYGEDYQQILDLYIPEGVNSETSLYFHIHGGAWIMGDKSNGAELAENAAKKYNIVGVTIGYRLLKEGDHSLDCKTLLDDINSAMAKVKDVCLERGITLKKAIVRGDSAGGHLALMYAYLYKKSSPVEIGLVESNCGPTDMTDRGYLQKDWSISRKDMMMLYGLLIGKDVCTLNYYTSDIQKQLYAVSPCCYVSSNVPATIFNSCGKDTLVPKSNGDKLNELLNAYGVDHYYTCFDYGIHCCRDELDFEKSQAYDVKFDQMMSQYVL